METPTLEQLIDLPALERFVNEHVRGDAGPIVVEKHTAGFSNETFYVSRGDERWVLRRPPNGPLLPTAHDVIREHRFLAALHGKARVPRPVAVCEDASVIGAPFYLMERTEGAVMRDAIPPAYDTEAGHAQIASEMIDALIELHAVDWKAAGIEGRESGYVSRQVKRWSSQWELTRPRTRELKGLDEITEWLRARIPAEVPATIVHGDYKLDNVMFGRDEPKLLAIFDWEMATVGDPLADMGWLLNHWAPMPRAPGYPEGGAIPPPLTTRAGFPGVAEMSAMYEERSGRQVRDLLFYRVLAAYKGAVIIEGLYMHYLEGAAANPGAADFEWRVPMTIESIQRLIAVEG